MADEQAVVVIVKEIDAAVVRWLCVPDDHPAEHDYVVVERGGWLAFSDDTYSIFATDDANLRTFYDQQ